MKKVGIRKLKAGLSAYVRKVRSGEVVLVTDRGEIVAQLRAPGDDDADSAPALRYRNAVAAGWLRPPVAPDNRAWLEDASVRLPRGAVQTLLDAERDEQ